MKKFAACTTAFAAIVAALYFGVYKPWKTENDARNALRYEISSHYRENVETYTRAVLYRFEPMLAKGDRENEFVEVSSRLDNAFFNAGDFLNFDVRKDTFSKVRSDLMRKHHPAGKAKHWRDIVKRGGRPESIPGESGWYDDEALVKWMHEGYEFGRLIDDWEDHFHGLGFDDKSAAEWKAEWDKFKPKLDAAYQALQEAKRPEKVTPAREA